MNRKSWTELTKRFLPCLCAAIAILICIFALPTEADAASESDLTFALNSDGKSYYVSDCKTSASGELIIPETYNGKPVTSIVSYAFYNCTSLTSITIPDSVTSIGGSAFWECTSLESITIPDSVTSIDGSAFWGCTSLESITIPDGVTSIGGSAFWECTSLESITIPDSVTSIDDYAFSGCTSLTSVTIPNSVTTIGDSAFYRCAGLESITIPDSVTTIGDSAFQACSSLASVTIGDSVTTIGYRAFYNCSNLTQVYIADIGAWLNISFGNSDANPLSVNSNAKKLYLNGKLLTNVTVPSNVTKITDYAFYNYTSLTSVTIPNSVTTIGDDAFWGCTSLESITIPDSVISIGGSAFYKCYSLAYVTIGESVESIGYAAFCNCESLMSIIIPDSVTNIEGSAFENCVGLKSVTIGDHVRSIGKSAFRGCTKLVSIFIPDSVTSIGGYAFYNCESLASVIISDSVTNINSYMFCECRSLIDITISKNVTGIGEGAFYNCESLKTVTIPESVTSIGAGAFYNCDSLSEIAIPDSVTSIGSLAFSYCSGLTSVTIGIGVRRISEAAFASCSRLTTVNFNATECTNMSFDSYPVFSGCLGLTTVNIGNNVKKIPAYAFYDCDNLTSVTIGNSVESIGEDAFWNCCKLTNVVLPNSLKRIDVSAFAFCDGMTSINIPSGVQNIGKLAFSWCDGLTSVIIKGREISISSQAFYACGGIKTVWYSGSIADKVNVSIGNENDYIRYATWYYNCCSDEHTYSNNCDASCNLCEWIRNGDDNWQPKHDYVKEVIAPTYIKQGYTQYTCACGFSYKDTFVDALELSAPVVTVTVDAATGKPALRWAHGGEGVTYEIHRATSKTGSYTKVATVTTSNWIDTSASVGSTYYYKVKAVYAADTSLNSDFSAVVSATAKCATPVITASNNSSGKPVVSWSKVSGAKQYTVYVATSQNGSYKKLGTTKSTTYTDSKAKAGTTYFYKVIANASKSTYNSGYSNIVSCGVICGTPAVTVKIDANTGKPSLSWKKVDGAAKYAIYRDGELLTTTTALTYADTGAAVDTQYTYTVQALGKTEDLNGNPSKAVTATSGIAKPTIKGSIDAVSGKPVITWAAVEGAVKYEVYRSTKSNKSYSLVATVEELTYTDTSVSAGKTYYYQVKAVGEVSKSANSSYVKLTGKCATPAITVESNAKAQPVISWEKVSGAKKYTVYRSTSETSGYKSIGTSKTTSYTDTKATPGSVYYYKVIANASSSKYNSGYSNIVSCGVNCATPVVKVSNNASGAPVISWSKVTGATKYEIYLLGAEDDVTLATVTGTTWTDADGVVGDERYYGVRAIASAAEFSSEVSEAVLGKAIPATPKVSGKVGANKKPVLTWGEVEGATKYIVYRSTKKDKGYTVIGESEVLTYEDLTAAKGKTYYYKVVAVGDGVQSAQSSYAKVKSK